MTWIKLRKLPQHASFISSNFGEFWYRENSLNNEWQVITKDNTLYPGRWPDVVCNSLEEAVKSAEDHFAWNLVWIDEENEE